MSDYEANMGAQFDASVETNKGLPLGNMVRKTMYKLENFPPVELSVLQAILGDLYREAWEEIRSILIPMGGEQKVPIGRLIETLGEHITKGMRDQLFARPMWVVEVPNTVVMAGLTDSIDKHFKGSSYTAAWYVGLVSGTPTFAEGNTMATHAGWYEIAPYSGARPTLTLGTVSSGSVDNSASKAIYAITATTMVVGGAFLTTLPTAGQTSGTLYGGAAFTGGNRTVASGDTLNVTVTLSATAS
jgi:hypothetical protein